MNSLERIKGFEGFSSKPYSDIYNNLTIGYGRNLSSNGISMKEAEMFLESDYIRVKYELTTKVEGYQFMNENAKAVLEDMCFNMGINKLLEFKKMLLYIRQELYNLAALEIVNSLYYKQLPSRAKANILLLNKNYKDDEK